MTFTRVHVLVALFFSFTLLISSHVSARNLARTSGQNQETYVPGGRFVSIDNLDEATEEANELESYGGNYYSGDGGGPYERGCDTCGAHGHYPPNTEVSKDVKDNNKVEPNGLPIKDWGYDHNSGHGHYLLNTKVRNDVKDTDIKPEGYGLYGGGGYGYRGYGHGGYVHVGDGYGESGGHYPPSTYVLKNVKDNNKVQPNGHYPPNTKVQNEEKDIDIKLEGYGSGGGGYGHGGGGHYANNIEVEKDVKDTDVKSKGNGSYGGGFDHSGYGHGGDGYAHGGGHYPPKQEDGN